MLLRSDCARAGGFLPYRSDFATARAFLLGLGRRTARILIGDQTKHEGGT